MMPNLFKPQRLLLLGVIALSVIFAPEASQADGSTVGVQLDVSKAGPRVIENETERRILSDYRLAWTNISQAMESNTSGSLQVLFVGPAKEWLDNSVSSQQRLGLTTKYLNQNHKLQVVFYSPEGDVIELHDTAQYETQVLDGNKIIHDDQETHHYVVLMTPGADRWVVRQVVSVPQF